MAKRINRFWELDVYKMAFEAAMEIFQLTKTFAPEERFSLTDQIRRSSRSVTANIAEAWHKRRYEAAFVCKLNDAEAEAGETQNWLYYAEACQYLAQEKRKTLHQKYDQIIGKLVIMINQPENWIIKR